MRKRTRRTFTGYYPVHADSMGKTHHYLDAKGKKRVYKSMKQAAAFIEKQKDEIRFVVESKTINTVYAP